MKTLSFVKQALAVALLISASQATAMETVKKYAKSVVTAHERGVAWLTRKALGCEATETVLDKLQEKGLAGEWREAKPAVSAVVAVPEVRDATSGAVVTEAVLAVDAQAAVPGKWVKTNAGTKGIRSVIYHVNKHSNKYIWGTRVALLAGLGYGAYKLYKKYYAKTAEEVTVEENKEDAQPTTTEVVVEETTAEPVKPARTARRFNPAA